MMRMFKAAALSLLLVCTSALGYVSLGAGNAVSLQVPSDVVDLTKFSMSLPYSGGGSSGTDPTLGTLYNKSTLLTTPITSGCYTQGAAGNATELDDSVAAGGPSSLVGFSDSKYFYALNGVVHYVVPQWGSTTSTNTDSPRTELRSKIAGTGATGSNASKDFIPENNPRWHLVGGVVRQNTKLNSVHVFQIHPDKDATCTASSCSSDVLLITSFDEGTLSATIKKFDQSGLYSTVTFGTTVGLATQGSPNKYDISGWYDTSSVSGDDTIHWTVAVNGGSASNFDQAVERAWRGRAMYFKGGAYSSGKYYCGDDAAAAIANSYTLTTPTEFFESVQTTFTVSLDHP